MNWEPLEDEDREKRLFALKNGFPKKYRLRREVFSLPLTAPQGEYAKIITLRKSLIHVARSGCARKRET